MHAEHNLSPQNGLHDTPNIETLSLQLRRFAENHNWHEPDIITNRLKLRRAFAQPVVAAAAAFMAAGRIALALQVKAEFARLLETTGSLDRLCVKRCDEEDELVVLEHFKVQLKRMLLDMASLLESNGECCRNEELRMKNEEIDSLPRNTRKTQKIIEVPADSKLCENDDNRMSDKAKKTEWVTVTEAAGILGVTKGTVSKWAQKGRFADNGLTGPKKMLSKVSVLLVKQELEEKELRQDILDLREDGRRISS
jgi:hypothetical protein